MTKRRTIIAYILFAILCSVAYPFSRNMLIEQEPTGFVTTSNLTLNYVLLFVLVGAISPWLASRIPFLRRFKKSTASGMVMVTGVCLLLIILTLVGMSMRWTQ